MYLDKPKLMLAMARACVNAQELAATAELPPQTLNAAIRGRNVRPATLGRIARALGVDPAEIVVISAEDRAEDSAKDKGCDS